MRLFLVALTLALAACETRYPDRAPLRELDDAEDALYFRCLRFDPFFASDTCRRFRRHEP